MKLTLQNLGPIKKGSIDLNKNLIIITGPNNTGKSYLSYLIHGISQYADLEGFSHTQKNLLNAISELSDINKCIEGEKDIDLISIVNANSDTMSKLVTDAVQNNLSKIFASSQITCNVKINFGKFYTGFNGKNSESVKEFRVRNGRFQTINWKGKIEENIFYEPPFDSTKDTKALVIRMVYLAIDHAIENRVKESTYFFPAERTAINLFAKHITATKAEIKDELDTEVITGMSDEELGKRLRAQVKAAPKYPYAIRSYINFVNNFKPEEKEGDFAKIASDIEDKLTGGKVHLDQFDQLIFTPKHSKSPLELHLSSSLVKSLSYLILYLRYKAKKNDQVIIDEPELNLHPDLQIAIARIIAEMINAGLKVIISTHSDYLIKELNNLTLLNELSKFDDHKEFITNQGYKPEYLLDREEVATYFLNDNTITLVDIRDNGIEVATINDAMTSVDSLAGEVYFRLQEATSAE